jgi:hypothetical protein
VQCYSHGAPPLVRTPARQRLFTGVRHEQRQPALMAVRLPDRAAWLDAVPRRCGCSDPPFKRGRLVMRVGGWEARGSSMGWSSPRQPEYTATAGRAAEGSVHTAKEFLHRSPRGAARSSLDPATQWGEQAFPRRHQLFPQRLGRSGTLAPSRLTEAYLTPFTERAIRTTAGAVAPARVIAPPGRAP